MKRVFKEDNNSNLPSYKKIASEILQRIHKGIYKPQTYLPSENKLAKEFSVTRSTVRKALEILKQEETIESFQGKGYRVKSLYWEQSLLQFYSFGLDIADNLQFSKTRLISCGKIGGLTDIQGFTDKKLWEIRRLRIVNEKPLILETSYIPVEYLPEFTKNALIEKSLYNLLEDNDTHIIRAKEFLEPVNPSLDTQRLLDISSNNPLFQTIRYSFDSEDNLIELRESMINGVHFRFSVEMTL